MQHSRPKLLLAVIKGGETTSQIASRFGIHPSQVRLWKRQLLDNASAVFEKSLKKEQKLEKQIRELYRQIGQLTVERDFLARKSGLL